MGERLRSQSASVFPVRFGPPLVLKNQHMLKKQHDGVKGYAGARKRFSGCPRLSPAARTGPGFRVEKAGAGPSPAAYRLLDLLERNFR